MNAIWSPPEVRSCMADNESRAVLKANTGWVPVQPFAFASPDQSFDAEVALGVEKRRLRAPRCHSLE